MTAHRALPLDDIEARARAARTPWPSCQGSCEQGRAPCDCQPTVIDRLPEDYDSDASSEDMSGTEAATLLAAYVASILFVVWVFSLLADYLKGLL